MIREMGELVIPILLLAVVFAVVAFCYASVGLGGGSSYTALLVISGAGMATIPMISLILNLLVTTSGSIVFLSRGHGRLHLISPFLAGSVPMAYLGGMLHLPRTIFYPVLLLSLAFAAVRIYLPGETKPLRLDNRGKVLLALFCGAILGLVAGITGIGGGVYLVPLIILLGLGTAKEAAACGAMFIWANSVAGLASRLRYNSIDLVDFLPLIIGAVVGGLAGSLMGGGHFEPRTMHRMLSAVLVVAIVILGGK
jgi:uncharacterized protein